MSTVQHALFKFALALPWVGGRGGQNKEKFLALTFKNTKLGSPCVCSLPRLIFIMTLHNCKLFRVPLCHTTDDRYEYRTISCLLGQFKNLNFKFGLRDVIKPCFQSTLNAPSYKILTATIGISEKDDALQFDTHRKLKLQLQILTQYYTTVL